MDLRLRSSRGGSRSSTARAAGGVLRGGQGGDPGGDACARRGPIRGGAQPWADAAAGLRLAPGGTPRLRGRRSDRADGVRARGRSRAGGRVAPCADAATPTTAAAQPGRRDRAGGRRGHRARWAGGERGADRGRDRCAEGRRVIGPTGAVRVLVATKPVDFRKGATAWPSSCARRWAPTRSAVRSTSSGRYSSGEGRGVGSLRDPRIRRLRGDGRGCRASSTAAVQPDGSAGWRRCGPARRRATPADRRR